MIIKIGLSCECESEGKLAGISNAPVGNHWSQFMSVLMCLPWLFCK